MKSLVIALFVAALGGGLWSSGVFTTRLTTKQWLIANKSQFELLAIDKRAIGSESHNSRNGFIKKLRTLREMTNNLEQSGCPDWHLTRDFSNVTQTSFHIVADLQTSAISLSSQTFNRDIKGLISCNIAMYEKFNAIAPTNLDWGMTITGTSQTGAKPEAYVADAQTVEVAIAAYQAQSGAVSRKTNIVLGSPDTYSAGHFAKLLVHSGDLLS